MTSKYYQSCAETAADQMGLDLSAEQIAELAELMEHAAEMEGEATGSIYIPNPMEAEVRRRDETIRRNEADHEKAIQRLNGVIDEWKRECRRLSYELERARAAS